MVAVMVDVMVREGGSGGGRRSACRSGRPAAWQGARAAPATAAGPVAAPAASAGPAPAASVSRRSSRRRPDRSVYRRRRLLAAGTLLLLAAAALATVLAALAGTGGGPLAATGAGPGMSEAAASVWVVRPGDTLWGIARAVDPAGDPRGLVDRLVQETGGSALYPGERIVLPAR